MPRLPSLPLAIPPSPRPHLRPPLLVSDLALVLEMSHDLGLAGQRPHEASSVGRRVLLGRPDPDVGLVDVGGGVVHQVDQQPDELVDYVLVLVLVGDLEGVVEEDVGCERAGASSEGLIA